MTPAPIQIIDLHFRGSPRAVAAFLVRGPQGNVLIECGAGSTLPALKQGLQEHGLTPADIGHVLLTHIHLDHAGAAGWWAQQGAEIYVHAFGAPHLVAPEKLLASATRIYGDQMDVLWGPYLPSPAERVHALNGGEVVEVAGLSFTAHDTPGHARHHLVWQLDDVAFVGDVAAIRLEGGRHIRIPSPPPEFEREAWLETVDRMRAVRFGRLYLTHFGAVENVDDHWARVATLVDAQAELARDLPDRETLLARLDAFESRDLDEVERERLNNAGPMGMSADGLLRYWKKLTR
ncbi:MAG TPA: MBL fold metallo-hydrolase [Anaerolineales bacterium]|nr:MBL fold metallo-hydrolase [Anaerolineales bacterium]HRF47239.1 MBL fold metallo-hydrolase [Anaerolineales bacterium]